MSVKDKYKALGVAAKARTMGIQPEKVDEGPDVSGLNDRPSEPGIFERLGKAIADPTEATGAAAQKFAQGASYGFSDELQGGLSAMDEASAVARQAVGLEDVPEVLADPVDGSAPPKLGMLRRVLNAYRKGRDQQQQSLDTASEAHPAISAVAELGGAMLAPGPKVGPLPQGVTRLQRMAAMAKAGAPVGAAFGLGQSRADLTRGDVGGAALDTAKGAGIGGVTGAVVGGALHGPLSRLEGSERAAIEKAEKMAREAYDAPQRTAQGVLGGVTQKGHRNLEAAADAIADPAIDRDIQDQLAAFLKSPQGVALRNKVMANKAESLPGQLSEIDEAQRVFDAARAANTPEAVAAKQAEILSPETFRKASGTRIKKYLGRLAAPAIGSAAGGLLGGPEGVMVGGALGTILAPVLGAPGTALANWARTPAVAMRLAQAGQAPAQAAAQGVTSIATDPNDEQRILEWLAQLGAEK